MRGRLIVSGVLVIAGASVGLAVAAGDLHTASESATAVDAYATATARCDEGERPVSGGFRTTQADEIPARTAVTSRKAGRGWRVRHNFLIGEDADNKLTTIAYCRQRGLRTVNKTTELPAESELFVARAKCPAGMNAVSGGFTTTDPTAQGPFANSSRRAGKRGWKVAFDNLASKPVDASVQVNCDDRTSLRTVRESADLDPGLDYEVFPLSARCRRSERVIAGGYSSNTRLTEGGAFILASKRGGDRTWKISVSAAQITPRVAVFAYCEKR
jgi:hypothetical protein